jgi:hypothetical protein
MLDLLLEQLQLLFERIERVFRANAPDGGQSRRQDDKIQSAIHDSS